ncbi:MAG: NAD(P)-dependent oxidoreductase [Alphaproteobacteria bacterium]|nr:NAD(P)-dependent oxidoreductase [Alphaproteobacteria bacterium]
MEFQFTHNDVMHEFFWKLLNPLHRLIIPYPSAHDTNLRRLALLHTKCMNQPVFENSPKVTILGTSDQVGVALLRRLLAGDAQVFASRHVTSVPLTHSHLTWFTADLTQQPLILPNPTSVVFSTVNITLLPQHIPQLASQHVQHIIALSSTSVMTKSKSPNKKEQLEAQAIHRAEKELQKQCAAFGIAFTIFRPSLIYGYGLDLNITLLDNMIKRYSIFLFPGKGKGKRAPTHADDVAQVMLSAFINPISRNKIYSIEGGDVMTMRDIVTFLFHRYHKKPRIFQLESLPKIFEYFPFGPFNSETILRMERDMLFDDSQARSELGYDPRPFSLDY